MSKVIHLNDYRRIDTRSSDEQRELELRRRNAENVMRWMGRAFRGGLGHRGPEDAA